VKKSLLLLLVVLVGLGCKKPTSQTLSVAFYNVENLFDTEDDPSTFDEAFTPKGEMNWTQERYAEKLANLAKVIDTLTETGAPQFLGLCEVENAKVIEDLLDQTLIADENYKYVHLDSKDERGIDVAFVYDMDAFEVLDYKAIPIDLSEWNDKTRDILYVNGKTKDGTSLHFYINHWPSRREGRKETEPKRIAAAKTLYTSKKALLESDPDANIIVMGDFNDEPSNISISDILKAEDTALGIDQDELYNPMARLESMGLGSYRFRQYWDMLDQIMISGNLLTNEEGYRYIRNSVEIKDDDWLRQHGNKYEGFPLRTYGGRKYLGGYSDHFPVYLKLQYQTK
jgi:predicted extracellular nuclease